MKKNLLLALCFLCFAPLAATEIVINNRILAKVQEQTISVIDVMKQMDIALNQNYPEHAKDPVARFQFYTSQWRLVLAQMIDNELILADAELKKVKVSDGDLREEIQNRFGPNVMSTLDKLGLTYEEARKIVYTDMMVQKMTWFKINSKAVQSVNSLDIKTAYQKFCFDLTDREEWEYQVISIRSLQQEIGEKVANLAHQLLANNEVSIESLPTELVQRAEVDPKAVTIQVSDLKATKKELSQSHKEVISGLTTHSFSLPILQKSRQQPESNVHRIFFVKDHKKHEPPALNNIANRIENDLIHKAIQKESLNYLQKLRTYFGYDEKYMAETIPENFEPFQLK